MDPLSRVGSGGLALLALLVLPLAGALLAPFARDQRRAFALGLVVTGLELLLALSVLLTFLAGGGAVPLDLSVPLFRFLGLHLALDGLSALFVPLVALLGFLVVLYAEPKPREEPGLFVATVLAYELALMGIYLSLDALLFWLFAVLELVLAAWLAGRWGTGQDRARAVLRFVELVGLGLLLLLAGFVIVGAHQAVGPERLSFDLPDLLSRPLPAERQGLVFFLLFYGSALRMPLFPFHAWLPVLAQQGTVVVGGVFLMGAKVGAYGLLRFALPLVPEAAERYAGVAVVLGVISLLYGAVLALMQLNLRRLLAFATVSHMGAVVIGLFSLNLAGLQGAVLLQFSFGVAIAGLLFATGFIYRRTHTAQLPRLGGLFDPMPMLGLTFLVACLSSIAMPGTAGFDGGHLLMEGSVEAHGYGVAIVAALGNVLAAGYLLRAYQRVFLAPSSVRQPRGWRDLRLREGLIAAVLAGVVFGVGLAPQRWLGAITGDLREIVARVEGPWTRH